MSVNLNISFEIHHILKIHQEEDGAKRQAILDATNQFLKEEGIADQGIFVDFLGQDGYLAAHTTHPIVVSRAYDWVNKVTKKWEAMAIQILGDQCKPIVKVEYEDQDF